MDPGADEQPDTEALARRVEQLEAEKEQLKENQAEQRKWWKKALPDRRGVIKGLGAAALGGAAVGASTGGASGQSATGQVGTASNPVDVEGAQGNFDSVSTDEVNNTNWIKATASDAQSDIESLGENDVAYVYGGAYDPGSETTIPVRASLFFTRTAWWEPSSDYNGFFMDNGGEFGIRAITRNAALSSTTHVVSLDTTRSTNGSYIQTPLDKAVGGSVVMEGTGGEGIALKLETGASNFISTGNRLDVEVWGCHEAVRTNSNNFVNFDDLFINVNNAVTALHHLGTGGFDAQVRGAIQPNTVSDRAIWNETSSPSVNFSGKLWDTFDYGIQPIEGQQIKAVTTGSTEINDIQGQGTAGSETYVFAHDRGGLYVWDGSQDQTLRSESGGSSWYQYVNGQQMLRLNQGADRVETGSALYLLGQGKELRMKDTNNGNHRLLPETDGLKYIEPDGTVHDLSTV